MATGVPNPEVPSMMAAERECDQHALQSPIEGDVDDRFLDDLELAADDAHGVEKHHRQKIQMMPRKPDSTPSRKADAAENNGMPKAMQETTNAAITP